MVNLKIFKSRLAAFLLSVIFCIAMAVISLAAPYAVHIRANAEEAPAPTRVVGYLPNWSYQAYKELDLSALTHVNIAFCNADSSGNISGGIPDSEMRAIVSKAHENNVKVMAALGGGGYCDGYRSLIDSQSKIDTLNANVAAFCEQYGLDGIDLDIELGSGDSIWNNYGAWVTSLRTVCDEHGWQLSTATAQWVAEKVTPQTFALFDFVNVMAYDNDSSGTTSHSSYEFAEECLRYFSVQKQVPAEKLVLGVPFYGRGYSANGALDWNSYLSFGDLVAIDAANFNVDNYNGVAYTGAATMREKCRLAKEYGGVMIWEITLDAEGEYSLLGVIKEEMSPADVPGGPAEGAEETPKDNKTLWIVLSSVAAVLVIAVVAAVVVRAKKKKDAK